MKPIIDVHEHIFRARDIPVKGYLYSRKSRNFGERLARFLGLPSLLARCIRKPRRGKDFGLFCRILIGASSALEREDYRTWAEILSLTDIAKVAEILRATFAHANISLSVPLVIDYEYWFRNTVDVPLVHQIDDIYRHVVRRAAGHIHPFVPFDPLREIAYRKGMQNRTAARKGMAPWTS